MSKELRAAASRIIGTSLATIEHLWQERFGRKLNSRRELVNWLCAEHHLQLDEAQDLPLAEIAALLQPDPAQLGELDRLLLQAMPKGQRVTGRDIFNAVGPNPTYDTIRQRLRPSAPLLKSGFIAKCSGQGYIRKM